jgi:hypothetical protein
MTSRWSPFVKILILSAIVDTVAWAQQEPL